MKIKVIKLSDIKGKNLSLCVRDYIDDDSIVDVRDRVREKEKTEDKE